MSETHNRLHRGPALPSDLGAIRTVMAADRTLMAWIRTALSLLSFSFTIYKFLEAAGAATGPHLKNPQRVGLFLAGVGTLSMILGVVSYWATLKDLQRTEHFRLGRPTLIISAIMTLAGIGLFYGIAVRVV
jgi:putative membrane protein